MLFNFLKIRIIFLINSWYKTCKGWEAHGYSGMSHVLPLGLNKRYRLLRHSFIQKKLLSLAANASFGFYFRLLVIEINYSSEHGEFVFWLENGKTILCQLRLLVDFLTQTDNCPIIVAPLSVHIRSPETFGRERGFERLAKHFDIFDDARRFSQRDFFIALRRDRDRCSNLRNCVRKKATVFRNA